MEKTQQIILTQSISEVEFALWTLGLPFEIIPLTGIDDLQLQEREDAVWICFEDWELEKLKTSKPILHILQMLVHHGPLSPSNQDRQATHTKASAQKINNNHTHKSFCWDMRELPFEVGFPLLNWSAPKNYLSQVRTTPQWSACKHHIAFEQNTLYFGLNLKALFELQATQSLAFGFGNTPPQNRWPHEEVSQLDRGGVLILLRESIRYLLAFKNQELLYYPNYPEGYGGTFLYRVDTDGANFEVLSQYVELLNNQKIKSTLFVDTHAINKETQFPSSWDFHEWGVHCYEHKISRDMKMNEKNFQLGKILLQDFIQNFPNDNSIQGHAAPYGLHPQGLSEVQVELGFSFGSEFSFAYDCPLIQLDSNPQSPNRWQIPWHPICPHSLIHSKQAVEDWIAYFQNLGAYQIQLGFSQAWYDHPVHSDKVQLQRWVEFLGQWVQGQNPTGLPLKCMSASEYLHWNKELRTKGALRVCPQPVQLKSFANQRKCRTFSFRRWKQSWLRKYLYRN